MGVITVQMLRKNACMRLHAIIEIPCISSHSMADFLDSAFSVATRL